MKLRQLLSALPQFLSGFSLEADHHEKQNLFILMLLCVLLSSAAGQSEPAPAPAEPERTGPEVVPESVQILSQREQDWIEDIGSLREGIRAPSMSAPRGMPIRGCIPMLPTMIGTSLSPSLVSEASYI